MKTRLSTNLQLGKAGEHFVCWDLMRQGFNAFLSDQGLPFDIIVEEDGRLYRVQVRTISSISSYSNSVNTYRFVTRHGCVAGGRTGRAVTAGEVEYYAFFVASTMQVAYVRASDIISRKTGKITQLMEFKTRKISYRKHPRAKKVQGKFIEDFSEFKI